jgi:NAD(P)-dependent dehydrogenase (short-subunit alcohol dehydrogenase family)
MSDIAIITGAASGIGYQVAERLLATDPLRRCVLADREVGWSQRLAELHGSERVVEVTVDVMDHAAVRACVDDVADRLGAPTQLVNCAGVQFNCGALDLSIDDWNRVIGTNLTGTFSFCQAAGRHMVAAGAGAIVNLASISMWFGFPRRLPYIASKGGVGGLTQTLAVEWAEAGVRVNAVAPGVIDTPLVQASFEKGDIDRAYVMGHHALGRLGQPVEVAAAIDFLLSDDASFITGEILNVDGGFRLKKI